MHIDKDLVAASATPLVLAILAEGESYGYAILKRVRELSDGEIEWTDGMLYPLLHRLRRLGYVTTEWRTPPEDAGGSTTRSPTRVESTRRAAAAVGCRHACAERRLAGLGRPARRRSGRRERWRASSRRSQSGGPMSPALLRSTATTSTSSRTTCATRSPSSTRPASPPTRRSWSRSSGWAIWTSSPGSSPASTAAGCGSSSSSRATTSLRTRPSGWVEALAFAVAAAVAIQVARLRRPDFPHDRADVVRCATSACSCCRFSRLLRCAAPARHSSAGR